METSISHLEMETIGKCGPNGNENQKQTKSGHRLFAMETKETYGNTKLKKRGDYLWVQTAT